MAHAAEAALHERQRRIESLVKELEADPDRECAARARELVGLVLDLHGEGLAAIMEVLGTSTERDTLLARLVEDERARAVLLLHGLHPDDLETRIQRSVDRMRASLGVDGIRIDLEDVAGNEVRVRVAYRAGAAKGPRRWMLPVDIEQAIIEAAPEIERVVVDGLDTAPLRAAVEVAG